MCIFQESSTGGISQALANLNVTLLYFLLKNNLTKYTILKSDLLFPKYTAITPFPSATYLCRNEGWSQSVHCSFIDLLGGGGDCLEASQFIFAIQKNCLSVSRYNFLFIKFPGEYWILSMFLLIWLLPLYPPVLSSKRHNPQVQAEEIYYKVVNNLLNHQENWKSRL